MVPIIIPQVFEFRQFDVAVKTGDVDRSGQSLFGVNVDGRAAGGKIAVPGDHHSSQGTFETGSASNGAKIQVGRGRIVCSGPTVNPDAIGKDRGLRGLEDITL